MFVPTWGTPLISHRRGATICTAGPIRCRTPAPGSDWQEKSPKAGLPAMEREMKVDSTAASPQVWVMPVTVIGPEYAPVPLSLSTATAPVPLTFMVMPQVNPAMGRPPADVVVRVSINGPPPIWLSAAACSGKDSAARETTATAQSDLLKRRMETGPPLERTASVAAFAMQ